LKIYNLVIVYDDTGDSIEYIEETVEDIADQNGYYIASSKRGDSRTTTLEMLERIEEEAKA